MEVYPPAYVEHDLPLVFLSGLGEQTEDHPSGQPPVRPESGTRINTSSAECTSDRAKQLLKELLQHDGRQESWNASALPGPTGSLKYQMKVTGRVGMQSPCESTFICG